MDMSTVPCVIMRGGTSKGIYIKKEDMPLERSHWERFLLGIMGSPDKRQIDGLGGAHALTSKVAIIGLSSSEQADVDYTFAQVSLTDAKADFSGNCGNISSGVGPFAVNEGLLSVDDGPVTVRIFNTNTGKIIESSFRVKDGMATTEGQLEIPGVPGRGAPIELTFHSPEGAVTQSKLPTGKTVDHVQTSFGDLAISIIDAANPLVFIRAADLGLQGTELPEEFDQQLLGKIEEIRSIAAELCGFASRKEASKASPAVPKSTIVSGPKDYLDQKGREHRSESYDLSVRMMSMQQPHQALAITGAVCISVAAQLPGTIVSELIQTKRQELRLGHPGGIMQTKYFATGSGSKVAVFRTARPLMKGLAYLRKNDSIANK